MADHRNEYTLRTVSTVFNAILDQRGVLDPEEMHDEFADPNHPLHHRYEWDDSVAGRKHRVQQIRGDIRLVRVNFVDESTGDVRQVRAYSSLKFSQRPDARGYIETDRLLKTDPIAEELLLRRLQRQLTTIRQQYGHLSAFTVFVQQELLGETAQTA